MAEGVNDETEPDDRSPDGRARRVGRTGRRRFRPARRGACRADRERPRPGSPDARRSGDLPGHSLRQAAGRRPALAPARACPALERGARRGPARPGVPADFIGWNRSFADGSSEDCLYLDISTPSSTRRAPAGDGLDPRRGDRRRRHGRHRHLERIRPARGRAGGDSISAGRAGLLSPPGADRRAGRGVGQLRPDGPDRGAEVGEGQHRPPSAAIRTTSPSSASRRAGRTWVS